MVKYNVTSKDESKKIGKTIARVRKDRGLTQSDLAWKSGLSVSAIAFIETGRRNPTIPTLARIAAAMGVKPAEIIPKEYGLPEGLFSPPASRVSDKDMEDLGLGALEDLGRQLMREHRAAIEAGDLERAADIYRRRVDLWQQIEKLDPPLYRITVKADGPAEVLFYREPTESELADLEARYPGFIESRDLVPAL